MSLAVLLFRVFAAQVLFYGIGALAIGVLNSHRRFFLPTFAPVLNNLVVISSFAAYMLLSESNPATAIRVLAAGTTLGVAAMSLALLPAVWRLGYRPQPVLGHPALRPAARLAGPMLLFVASSVGVQVAAVRFASGFDGNDEAWYAFTVFQLPYGVFAVAIALMPELSERFARDDTDGYRETLSFGLRTTAFYHRTRRRGPGRALATDHGPPLRARRVRSRGHRHRRSPALRLRRACSATEPTSSSSAPSTPAGTPRHPPS